MSTTELPAGQVTVADLYREMTGTRSDVAAARADVARALTRIEVIDARNQTADRLDIDHENRIRSLEAFRWKLVGLALAVSVLVSLASGLFTVWITKH